MATLSGTVSGSAFLGVAQFGFAPALAGALLQSLWQCAAIAALAALVLQALKGGSAALRHTAGLACLVLMAALPAWEFARFWWRPEGEINGGAMPAMIMPAAGAAGDAVVLQSNGWALLLSLVWLAGASAMLLRHLAGLWWVGRLQRRAFEPLSPDWQRRMEALQHTMRVSRRVAVRVAEDVISPFTARLIRPVIWVPVSLFACLPREQIEALFAHELAHIRRLDWLWNAVQCVIESLLFYHPGVWWLSRRIREEREHACDDLAVSAGANAISLAEALTTLAHVRKTSPHMSLAAQGGSLMTRITRLLPAAPKRTAGWAPLGAAALLTTSALFAAQLGTAASQAPLLQIETTTRGELEPLDTRTITSRELGKQREYISDADAQGRVTETYSENGVARPIDADVRAWIDETLRLSAVSEAQARRDAKQAALDAKQAQMDSEQAMRDSEQAQKDSEQSMLDSELAQRESEEAMGDSERAMFDLEQVQRRMEQAMRNAELAERASELAGRAVPRVAIHAGEYDAETKAVVRLVAADPSVARTLGTPVEVTSDGFTGRWGIDHGAEPFGYMRISFSMAGPEGEANILVAANAKPLDSPWELTELEITDFKPR